MSGYGLLSVRNLDAYYGDFQALFGVSICIDKGEVVAIIGSNGAGKSTLLKSISGLIWCSPDAVVFKGLSIGGKRAHQIAPLGIALVPEGRRLFPSLSVEENLLIGAASRRTGFWTLKRVCELFPILGERRHQSSMTLSGGQQQMVAIGRALMGNPDLLMCDELSLGLAPIVIRDIYSQFATIRAEGLSLIIVEQDIGQAIKVSSRVYCLQHGRVSLHERACNLTREQISAAYFGVA